jgi:hypothetical protein
MCTWVPFFAYFVRQKMNFRMRLNMKVATNMTDENDVMTRASERFLEQEVKDEKLREILNPRSKCKYPSTKERFPTSFLSPIDRLL